MKQLIFLMAVVVLANTKTWAQQSINRSKSKATFTVRNLGVKVDGSIRGMYGEVRLDPEHLEESFIRAKLDVRAIRTGIELRDKHLMEERFFFKDKYPTLSFVSKDIREEGGQFIAKGQLTIRDVTKEVEVPFTREAGVYSGGFTINRKDYNVHNKDFLTKGISNEVNIQFTVVLGNKRV